jgi:ABC-type transport system involved in multi-copper enzyme maturation permease subunit
MLLTPVLERELRVQARLRGLYWLRMAAGLAGVLTLGLALSSDRRLALSGGRNYGPWLLALLHTIISLVFALACPLISADTLARERREGTLGLLLLTPLTALNVVSGKFMVHLVRALTMWLAVLPVLVVPLLMGGVGSVDIAFVLVLELGVVLASLSAGIVASSLAVRPGRAITLALVLTALAGETLALVSFLGLLPSLLANPTSDYWRHVALTATLGPWFFGTGLLENGFSGMLGRNPAWLGPALFTSLAGVFAASWGLVGGAFWFASRRVVGMALEGSVRERPRRGFWLAPRQFGSGLGKKRARLRRQPMLWLFTTKPASHLVRWGWTGLALGVWILIYLAGFEDRDTAPWALRLPLALAGGLSLAACMSLRPEIESGAMELLLVTPLRPSDIVWARALSLWRDWLPAMALATGLQLFWMSQNDMGWKAPPVLLMAWASFLTAPFIGIRFSLRPGGVMLAWAWTLALGVILPWGFGVLSGLLSGLLTETTPNEREGWQLAWQFASEFAVVQVAVAVFCLKWTMRDLAARRFG